MAYCYPIPVLSAGVIFWYYYVRYSETLYNEQMVLDIIETNVDLMTYMENRNRLTLEERNTFKIDLEDFHLFLLKYVNEYRKFYYEHQCRSMDDIHHLLKPWLNLGQNPPHLFPTQLNICHPSLLKIMQIFAFYLSTKGVTIMNISKQNRKNDGNQTYAPCGAWGYINKPYIVYAQHHEIPSMWLTNPITRENVTWQLDISKLTLGKKRVAWWSESYIVQQVLKYETW